MSPSLRVAPRLASLARRGLLHRLYDSDGYRYVYLITLAGREALRDGQAIKV